MTDYIKGTNIPVKDFKGSEGELEDLENRIAEDIAKGDWKGANDALFSIAYKSGKTGGQGNPSVGKVQSGQYRVTGKSSGGESSNISWAEQAVRSDSGGSDIYRERDDSGELTGKVTTGVDFGKPMTADDVSRATPGVTVFAGTNIPTTGFSSQQIGLLNSQIQADLAKGDYDGANDVLYTIAHERGKMFNPEGWGAGDDHGWEQGNPFIGMLQSDMYTLTDPRAGTWAEQAINSDNDIYNYRDVYGKLTGGSTTYNDDSGFVTKDSSGNVIRSAGNNLNNTYTGGGNQYSASPYSVPNMQTGGAWEGLGAEYEPGTVEGLGLLAGDPYTGYQPMASGLLGAAPSYNQTGGIFESASNKSGVSPGLGGQFIGYPNPSGSSSTSSDSWSPTWQFTTVNGGQQYGYFNQGGQWVRGGDQRS